MKLPKNIVSLSLLLLTTIGYVFCGTADSTGGCSVKNRWILKPSVSSYLGWEKSADLVQFGDHESLEWNARHINFRIEATYGLSKCWEIGLFAEFQQHATDVGLYDTFYFEGYNIISHNEVYVNKLAPTFGLSVNFHMLPLFVREKTCHWDLYLTANYGGCVLIHTENRRSFYGHYRQEYGMGVGLSYFIKNRAGFFAEFRFGNYSFFPQYVSSYSNFRAGLAIKLN